MRERWLLLLAACAAPVSPSQGAAWTVRDFFSSSAASFGGFTREQLTDDGQVLAVQPAFIGGKPAAYVITEIWQHHPDPWVPPVYNLVHAPDRTSIFGLGVESTFYSPFWQVWGAKVSQEQLALRSVSEVLNAGLTLSKGPLVMCPIIPEGVSAATSRPYTAEPVDVTVGHAFVDGPNEVAYLELGIDRQVVSEYEGVQGAVLPYELYVFARGEADGGRALLPVPAVLGDDAHHHAYVRRIDVLLNKEAAFVPFSRRELAADLGAFAVVGSASIPESVARPYTLRVASDSSCFDAGAFPGGCTWLDSEAAIDAHFPLFRIIDTDVTLTATQVLP